MKIWASEFRFKGILSFFVLTMTLMHSSIVASAEEESCQTLRQFTFSWQFISDCKMTPRGGVTSGPETILDVRPHKGWLSLQAPGLSNFERDRLAILAMAGPYRTSFDFLEVAGYVADFEPAAPYQSWSTEYVYVLEDTGEFISLQHLIVMFFKEGNQITGPMVMKHWRQDWQFEKLEVFSYVGNETWEKQSVPGQDIKGSWSQSVYQVDDSPRYESWGRWEHKPNFSTWESAETWRPLPRREYSVRNDYQVLEGVNRHSILPNGWLHEEINYKRALDKGSEEMITPYLAKELGVNRYELIVDHDFSEGDLYLEKTGAYWKDVRAVWADIIADHKLLQLRKDVDGKPLFMRLFEQAEAVLKNGEYSGENTLPEIRKTIEQYIVR